MTVSRERRTIPAGVPGIARDLLARALLPAVALILAGLAVGWLVVVPFASSTGEDEINIDLQGGRTPLLDTVARTASLIGSVEGNAVICVLAGLLIWSLSRKWWLALLPALALQLHIVVHIVTSSLVRRSRPAVSPLDIGQPTTSFPSGHVGATTAQLLVVLIYLWGRLRNRALKFALAAATLAYLVTLGWSRLYLGMHHLTDVIWGGVNGMACGLIAWLFMSRYARAGLTTDTEADAPTHTGDRPAELE